MRSSSFHPHWRQHPRLGELGTMAFTEPGADLRSCPAGMDMGPAPTPATAQPSGAPHGYIRQLVPAKYSWPSDTFKTVPQPYKPPPAHLAITRPVPIPVGDDQSDSDQLAEDDQELNDVEVTLDSAPTHQPPTPKRPPPPARSAATASAVPSARRPPPPIQVAPAPRPRHPVRPIMLIHLTAANESADGTAGLGPGSALAANAHKGPTVTDTAADADHASAKGDAQLEPAQHTTDPRLDHHDAGAAGSTTNDIHHTTTTVLVASATTQAPSS